jgi:hypothetical protein
LTDAFRFLYPDRRTYSFWTKDRTTKEYISATRIDHAIVSEHLLNLLEDISYSAVAFSDHHALILQLKGLTEVQSTAIRNQKHTETGETIVGPGVWKLYHGALTEESFCAEIRNFAGQLVCSRDFIEPFEIRAWEESKEQLRTQAKTISRLTGHKRKQPGRKMTEI